MAFGQQSGPPATGRQLKELSALLEQLGYSSFREARGPLGFNQRQGNGKFTNDEAAGFISQLELEVEGAAGAGESANVPPGLEAAQVAALVDTPPHLLARSLEERGWVVIPPEGYTA